MRIKFVAWSRLCLCQSGPCSDGSSAVGELKTGWKSTAEQYFSEVE